MTDNGVGIGSGRRSRIAMPAAVLVAGVLSAGAGATTPTTTQYGNPAASEPTAVVAGSATTKATPEAKSKPTTSVKGASATSKSPAKAAPPESTLPFTGLDLALVLGLGGALAAGGLVLRHAGRKRDTP